MTLPSFLEKNNWLYKFGLILISFCFYLGTFELSNLLPEQFKYDDWISLVFLPAGSKLILILLFGFWGTIGDIFALALMATQFFDTQPFWVCFLYATISGFSSFYGVHIARNILRISVNLSEIQFIHLPIICLVGNLVHGFITMLLLYYLNVVTLDKFWADTFAMIFGDFLGSFIFIMVFWLGLKIYKRLNYS